MLCASKHRRWTPTALVRTIPETFTGLGLSQQTAFCPQKAMLAGIVHVPILLTFPNTLILHHLNNIVLLLQQKDRISHQFVRIRQFDLYTKCS